jgi:hypothetical protein
MSPKKTSYHNTFDHKSGSNKEAKKPNENRKRNGNIRNMNGMKKVTQCIAIRNPTKLISKRSLMEFVFF